jgi:thiol:disulfide interchange protein DsbA
MFKYTLSILLFLVTLTGFAEDFVAGKDYIILHENSTLEESKNGVVVKEYFSYGCPWCYKLEPSLSAWVKQQGNKISFSRVPVVFNKDWEFYAKAFYTAEALQIEPKLTPDLFKAILTDKQQLNSNQAMIDFFKQHGVEENTANSAFLHSPSIDLQISTSKRMMGLYQITAVPTLIVNNKYKTDLQLAKNQDRLFAIMNFLVNKASAPAA